MTCDPVAGYVQVPCIERCAFGAVKAWIAYMIATNEIETRHRVDLDTTIKTLAADRQGHGSEIQGNERRRPGREPGPLLKSESIGMARPGGSTARSASLPETQTIATEEQSYGTT